MSTSNPDLFEDSPPGRADEGAPAQQGATSAPARQGATTATASAGRETDVDDGASGRRNLGGGQQRTPVLHNRSGNAPAASAAASSTAVSAAASSSATAQERVAGTELSALDAHLAHLENLRARSQQRANPAAIAELQRAASSSPPGGEDQNPSLDSSIYLPPREWFDLMQDPGTALTAQELQKHPPDPTAKGHRKRSSHRLGDYWYPKLYKATSKSYDLFLPKKDQYFPRMRTNKSDTCRRMFAFIMSARFSHDLASLASSAGDGIEQHQFTMAQEERYVEPIWFYSQKSFVEKCLAEFGQNAQSLKKATPDDFIRLVGLLMHEDLREHIPVVVSTKDISGRLNLDSWKAEQRRVYSILSTRFIDREVIVALPAAWLASETKEAIDAQCGEGFYDRLNLNPNNEERMRIPWSSAEMPGMLKTALHSLDGIMKNFKMDTGGGSGNEATVACWQDREPHEIVTYINHIESNIYLTILHMWDKMYGFPLSAKSGQVPPGVGVDDDPTSVDASSVGGSSVGSSRSHRRSGDSASAPLVASMNQRNQQMATFQRDMSSQMSQMVSAVTNSVGGGGQTGSHEMPLIDRQLQLQVRSTTLRTVTMSQIHAHPVMLTI